MEFQVSVKFPLLTQFLIINQQRASKTSALLPSGVRDPVWAVTEGLHPGGTIVFCTFLHRHAEVCAVPPPWDCPFDPNTTPQPPPPSPHGSCNSPDYPVPFSALSPDPGLLFTPHEQRDLGIIQTTDHN